MDMEAFAAQLEEMRRTLNEERAQRLATEERLRAAEARIAEAANNNNQAANNNDQPQPAPPPASASPQHPRPSKTQAV